MRPVLCVALGLSLAVLLLGTDVISPIFFFVALALLLVAWLLLVRRALKPAPVVARIIDRELALNDTISTAYFLLHEDKREPSPYVGVPLQQAASLAPTVRPELAFPFERRRRWAVPGVLCLCAVGCFIARYARTQTLDLHPSLLSLSIPPIFAKPERTAIPHEKTPSQSRADANKDKAASNPKGKDETSNTSEQQPPMPPLQAGASQDKAANGEAAKQDGHGPDLNNAKSSGETDAATSKSDGAQASGSSQPNGAPQNAAETQGETPKNDSNSAKGTASDSPGLMSRMKDALSSMMAKMSPKSGGQKSPNAGDPSSASNQDGQQAAKQGEQSSSQQGKGGQDKANSEQSPGGQGEGQTAEKTGGKTGQSSSSSQQGGADSQSGVGKQDGDKALRDAEQQQAMGKLAEIVGKRSENLTGDMTVETPSGNQQLKTAYSQQTGKHANSASEINRNEVPARYQRYVREYMEQVGKTVQQQKNPAAAK